MAASARSQRRDPLALEPLCPIHALVTPYDPTRSHAQPPSLWPEGRCVPLVRRSACTKNYARKLFHSTRNIIPRLTQEHDITFEYAQLQWQAVETSIHVKTALKCI